MDVIFSAPYSAAIFYWLAEQLRDRGEAVAPYDELARGAGYYRHAFRGAPAAVPLAITSTIMLDDIYIRGGDFAAPGAMRLQRAADRKLSGFGSGLGITVGPNLLHDASRCVGNSDDLVALATETEFGGFFDDWDRDEVRLELENAIADAMLVGELGRPLVCGPSRRAVIDALVRIGVITQEMLFADPSPLAGIGRDPIEGGRRVPEIVDRYREVTALRFDAPTLTELSRVKDDAKVRESAVAFQQILGGERSFDTDAELLDSMREARSAARRHGVAARLTTLASHALSIASLVPALGAAAGLAALALPAALHTTRPVASGASWYEFTPRVRSASASARLDARLATSADNPTSEHG